MNKKVLCADCGCSIGPLAKGEQRSLCEACEAKVQRAAMKWGAEKQTKH